MSIVNRVFVYGTLKAGGYFAKRVDEYRTDSIPHTIEGFDMYNINGKFPGVVKGNGNVIGEIHTFDGKLMNRVLNTLDMIEGYNDKNRATSLYIRELITIDGDEAYIYLFNDESFLRKCEKIDSGVWEI